ncbi:MAG TPA: S9 family peptidase [Ramlibacter sp.]|nr:S9 family peptidase [Ramlibacter sp.]
MTQPFQPEDLYLHQKLSDLHALPGLEVAVGTVRSVDRENDGYVSCIWTFPLDGQAPRQMTRGPGLDKSPRWSPQGDRIAFTSGRGGGAPQLYLIDRDGGEARPCSRLDNGVSSHRWAPDGKSLVVAAAVSVDPELRGARGKAPPKRGPKSPEIAWKLPYKSDGMGYMLAREVHLFRLDAGSGEHRQLTDGPFDVLGFEPSPNGRHIAYCRTREGRFAHRTDLWVCDADGGHPRQLTRELATVLQPAWSPDGRWIAFAAAREEGDAQNGLFVLEFGSGRIVQLGDKDLEVADSDSLHWSEDGARLIFSRAIRGCHEIASIAVDGSGLQTLAAGERQLGAVAVTGQHLVYSVEHPSLPSELYACGRDGRHERQISDLNPWWSERTAIQATRRSFEVDDGRGGRETIEGWLICAEGAKGPMPLLNDVHGGPASYSLMDFDTNVFWQVLCSRGWAVLALNAVGSSSYGREFCNRLAGHWGKFDLPQHRQAIEQLQAEGLCDERVAISGKSYGGYLSAWAVGHTDLFRAAVVMAPVGNIETHYGTSDGGYYADPRYLDAAPHFDRKLARALSPLQHIEKAATPTLFLQGKEDERCPKCQSEEMFVSLLRAGDTPTELILYPGEDHHFLGEGAPSVREDAARRIVDWITRWAAQPAPRRKPEAASATV